MRQQFFKHSGCLGPAFGAKVPTIYRKVPYPMNEQTQAFLRFLVRQRGILQQNLGAVELVISIVEGLEQTPLPKARGGVCIGSKGEVLFPPSLPEFFY